jgi:hypothetical protein
MHRSLPGNSRPKPFLTVRTILCLPAQSSGTWLAAALLPESHPLLVAAECNPAVDDGLARLPKTVRIKKNQQEYRAHADAITQQWGRVKTRCSQAQVFENSVRSKI